jgi:RNA polymerase sigma-70 factor (ECF subfamily)
VEGKPESLSDERLIYKIAAGEQLAFTELVHRYLSALVKFSARYTHSTSYSEDLVQEAFLRIWKGADSWSAAKGTVKSWLFKIAYNLTMDFLRKQALQNSYQESLKSSVSEVHSLERSLLAAEQKKQLHQALFDLPERQRTALTLFLVNGLTGREVAAVLELTIEASDSLLARARRNLKKTIQQEPNIKKAANL